jgi:phosphoribosylanthranilate isomerase
VKVKICGITNINDAQIAVNNGADALGFIFYKKSKRYIDPAIAKDIIFQLPVFVIKVGVFVNETAETINKIGKLAGLNAVQLHGDERLEIIDEISLPVLKAFRVNNNFDYTLLNKYKQCSFLLDTYSNEEYGGTGETFEWNSIPDDLKTKIILAGGISIENIEDISKNISPQAIDVSSSIEDSPGKKNHNKLINLLKKVNDLRDYTC